jgi:hypothetical protein
MSLLYAIFVDTVIRFIQSNDKTYCHGRNSRVVWTRLYKTSSGLEGGTMYQLRNLINRRSVVSDVSKDMNSCEDFLELVTKAHIVAAAISLVGAEDVANLSENILSGNSSSTLHSVAKSICAKLVTITFQAGHTPSSQNPDHVLEYAKEHCL